MNRTPVALSLALMSICAYGTKNIPEGYDAAAAAPAAPEEGYSLVWQDLFDADQLDPMRWDIEVNGHGGGNAELQYYTESDANVRLGDDGMGNRCLILTARRENYMGRSFTSGRLNTKNRVAFTHGIIEASIRMPQTADGLWPAFWLMGDDYDQVGWPRCGEIDIVEMGHADGIRTGMQDRYFNGACHWGPGWPNASYAKTAVRKYSLQDGEYHLYTMKWDPESIRMYVDLDKDPDQKPYYTMDIPADEPDNEWSAGNYFHKPVFIIFNLAVGGNFPGIHDPQGITALNEANGQEASMMIDYVRIYQKGTPDETLDVLVPGDPTADDSGVNIVNAGTLPAITFDGHSASASDPAQSITVYTASGTRVADARGTVSLSGLSHGTYLVKSGAATRKIVL